MPDPHDPFGSDAPPTADTSVIVVPVRPTQAEINQSYLSVDHLKVGIGDRTVRGGAIVMIAQVGRILVQLVTTFVLARLLAPDEFGVVAVGFTVLAFFALFTELGLLSVTVQTKDLDQDTTSALLYMNVGLTVVVFSIAALLSPLLVHLFPDPRVPQVVILLAGTVPLYALGTQHTALLMRNMRWMPVQMISLLSLFAGSVAAILLAWLWDAGYWALVAQAYATSIIGLIAVWSTCRWRPTVVRNWSGVGRALRTSLNLSGTMALQFLHRQVDVILIGWRWGSTELGHYTRSYSLLMLPMNLVSGPLTTAVIPALSRLQDEPEKWRRAFLDALIGVTVLGGGFCAILYGGSEPIVRIVLGPGWDRAEQVFENLVLAMFAATPMSTATWIWISLGRTFRMVQWGLISTAGFVAAFVIGLPYGAPGVALAYGCAQILAFLPCMWMATRGTSVSFVDVLKACVPVMLATVIVGLALRYVTTHVGLLLDVVAIAAAGFAYLAIVVAIAWRWPPHARVRDRGMAMLQKGLARFGPGRVLPGAN